VKEWRKIVGESWNVGALSGLIECWDTFSLKHERLILRAIVNFKESRKELAEIFDNMVR
jgi:hypothetical protein